MRPEAATFCSNCGQDLRPGAPVGAKRPGATIVRKLPPGGSLRSGPPTTPSIGAIPTEPAPPAPRPGALSFAARYHGTPFETPMSSAEE